jgi:uncharacterized membrane protein
LKNRPGIDLVLVIVITLLLIPAVVFLPSNIPRIILGLPFILFFPGYSLVSALFPARTRLSTLERVGYSLALSISIVALTGLLLNYVWSITLYPMLGLLTFLILALCATAWYRRRELSEDEKTYLRIRFNFAWTRMAAVDKILAVCLVLAVLGAAGASVFTYQKNQQGFTELYLLGAQGKAADYPRDLLVGQKAGFTLVVVNQERHSQDYLIKTLAEDCRVWVNGVEQPEISLSLEHQAQQSYDITFVFNRSGEGKKLEFDLYQADQPEVYLRTYLKVSVQE